MILASRLLKSRWSRVLSLLLTTPLTLVLLLHPAFMLNPDGSYSHGLLMLVMLGISSGFIHGVGFDPISPIWRTLFYPLLGWGLMALGYTIILHNQLSS